MNKKKIIYSMVSTGSYHSFVEEIIKLGKGKVSEYVCIANVHMLIEAFWDSSFNQVLNRASIVTPDGMPLAKGIGLLYSTRQARVAGMDLMADLMNACEYEKLSIFLYGSTDVVLDRIKEKARLEFKNLDICETYSPPFRPLDDQEKSEIIQKINNKKPNFVFVSLGCPKQEKWMFEHKDKINACMIGLGGAFPVYSGLVRRAPKWMQNYSLEWLFRLFQEPRRLLKRYAVTNTLFLCLFSWQYFKSFFSNRQNC